MACGLKLTFRVRIEIEQCDFKKLPPVVRWWFVAIGNLSLCFYVGLAWCNRTCICTAEAVRHPCGSVSTPSPVTPITAVDPRKAQHGAWHTGAPEPALRLSKGLAVSRPGYARIDDYPGLEKRQTWGTHDLRSKPPCPPRPSSSRSASRASSPSAGPRAQQREELAARRALQPVSAARRRRAHRPAHRLRHRRHVHRSSGPPSCRATRATPAAAASTASATPSRTSSATST